MTRELSTNHLLAAYANRIFPMADEAGIFWLAPEPRCIIPLSGFVTSRSLRARCRRCEYTITVNHAFPEVIAACADRTEGTWISQEILDAYKRLHRIGFAHSVEAWHGEELAGGLYGVSMGGAFFGESMFHRTTDASKVSLVLLVQRMIERKMVLLDVQFMTDHLRRFGAIEISRKEYERKLYEAIRIEVRFADQNDPKPVLTYEPSLFTGRSPNTGTTEDG